MKKIYTYNLLLVVLMFHVHLAVGQKLALSSPDGKLKAKISLTDGINYSLNYEGNNYILPSTINMALNDGSIIGLNPKLLKNTKKTVNNALKPSYGISSTLIEKYNALQLDFSGSYKLELRAYNEGFAYRFVTNLDKEIYVSSEKAEFRFNGNYQGFFHPALSESDYLIQQLSQFKATSYSSLPVLIKANDGMNILIHESDVSDFPCLSIKGEASNTIIGNHAAYPKKVMPGGYMNFNLLVKETENYIAKTSGKRSFPWRLVTFERKDENILSNQLVYLLAKENKIGDVSWVKPGKVAWDWWNALNLSGVDFKTGFNTQTYKYYIDFAAANGIEYVNLDEGWSDQFDLMKITTSLDLPAVIAYAKEKKVRLVLWCVWHTLDKQMIEALNQFANWGIAGIKVDFMDRDDQVVVNFQERLLKEAASRKLLVNYHGAYHPNGMERTYPNYINTEGVKGLEWNKFDSLGASPQNAVTIPFIRMFAGAMDYTPGAMQNYNKVEWKQIYDRPMSQGTRCHQLAMYTVYYAPIQMLADAPTAYEKEPIYLSYLVGVPSVWDQTVPMESKVGEYVCVARRKGENWFVGAMTGWKAKQLNVKLDFLKQGEVYNAEIFMDGPNAERVGNDYKRVIQQVRKGDSVDVKMAGGGGWSAKFTKIEKTK